MKLIHWMSRYEIEKVLLSRLQRFLTKHETYPEPPYWFWEGELDGYSEGDSFCEACIKTIMPDAKYGDNYTGGSAYESDGSCVCDKCSELLQYTLTDYGVNSELEHFLENPLEKSDLENTFTCYALARMAYGVSNKSQIRDFIRIFRFVLTKKP